jgi:hypothetical protein
MNKILDDVLREEGLAEFTTSGRDWRIYPRIAGEGFTFLVLGG